MMGEIMQFPETVEEFMQQYKITDSEQIYTNGSMLVPSFRVEQMIEHYFRDAVPVVRCKDCKYYKPDEFECGCDFAGGLPYVKADDFCSYGQRKNQSADVRNMRQFAGGGKTNGGSNERP